MSSADLKKQWIKKVPPDWALAKIGYVGQVKTGGTPSRENLEYWQNGNIPWLASGEVNKDIINSTDNHITALGMANSNATYLPAGSVLIALNGQGKTKGTAALLGFPATLNQSLAGIVPNPKKMNSKYLYYFLKDNYSNIRAMKGEARDGLNLDLIKSIPVLLPPITVQARIANYLDKKIEIITKMLTAKKHTRAQLSELRQAVITNAVLGREKTTTNLRDTNIPWIGKMPSHWQVKKVKHVATVKARIGWQALTTDEYIDEGPYLVTGTDFRDGVVDWKTAAHVSDQRWAIDSNIQLEEDDLLLTKDGTIGKVAMVKGLKGKATLNSGVFVIRTKGEEYNPRYLYHVLNSGVFTDFIEYMKTGSTINHLYQQTFVEFSFPLPSREEQDEIVRMVDQRLKQVDTALTQVAKSTNLLEEYRSSLISNVVGGKVQV